METTELATPTRARGQEAAATPAEVAQAEGSASVARARPGLTLRANFSWTFVGNAIDAAAWWAMTIVLAQLGSPEHVGQFALGLATTAPVFMFATLRLRDLQATDARGEYRFGDYLALRLTTTVLALLVVTGIAAVSGYSREVALVIIAHGLSKAFEAVSDAYYGLFMQHERLDRIAKSLMIKGPLSLVGLGIGFYLTRSVFWGVMGVVAARAVMMVAYDTRNAAMILRASHDASESVHPRGLPRPRWDLHTMGRLAWLGLPLGFVTMLISLNSNIPRYFIEGHLGSYQLGIFVAITAFQKTAPTVIQALGRSASPRMARYYASSALRAFRKLAFIVTGVGVLMGGAGVLVALVAGRQILTLFYGAEYALPALFVLVMLAAGLDYVATMLLFVVTSARYFRVQLPLQLFTTGTVALASFLLIPSLGLRGAALALVAGDAVRVISALAAAFYAERALHRRLASAGPDAGAQLEVGAP